MRQPHHDLRQPADPPQRPLAAENLGAASTERDDDGTTRHRDGRQRPLLYSRAAVERHTAHRPRLEPAVPANGAAPDRAP